MTIVGRFGIFDRIEQVKMKRFLDLSLVILLVIPSGLFFLLLAFLTVIIDHFPPIFTNKRVGRDGKIFTCYKLQCLKPPKSDSVLGDPKADRERMTRLGEIYRDHGWDELPQLLNIFRGEMSFVGPRPIPAKTYVELKLRYPNKRRLIDEWKDKRLQVLPGLSGWHQIHLNDHNIIKYDFEYFQNWTLAKSIKVFLISSLIFIIGKGRYYFPSIPPEVYEYQI